MSRKIYHDIKFELMGNGLISEVRKKFIPNTKKMSRYAQQTFEESEPDYSDFDSALYSLLQIEYDLYLKKEDELIYNFIELSDQITTNERFKTVRSIIDEFKNHSKDDPVISLKGISKIFIALADSNRQSRVSRSGSSFMHHISYLLEKNNFTENKTYKREINIKDDSKLDFFFPDVSVYNSEPQNCCAMACQTTSNDRYRQIFAQLPNDTRNRACSAAGHPNFGKNLGIKSISKSKLKKAKEEGFKFVLMNQVITDELRKSHSIMTYNELLDELRSLSNFW